MKKRISVLVLAILFALTLTSSFAAEAVPDWPPNVYSIALWRVRSRASADEPWITENMSGRNSTAMQHNRYAIEITVDQMGYEGQNDATLDGKQYDRLVGCEYLNANGTPTQQGQIIEGFRWTFAWDNVEAAEPFSTFKYWCTNANYPYGVHNYTATINWVNDGSPGPVLPELSTLKVNTLTETLTGAVNGVAYEYRTASTWTKVVAENSSFLIPFDTTATTLYVRYAATDTQPASNAVTISLPARPAAPSLAGKLSVSYLDSNFPNQAVLKGVPKGYLCDFFFTKTAVSSGSDIPFDYPDYSSYIYVRVPATSTVPKSMPYNFGPLKFKDNSPAYNNYNSIDECIPSIAGIELSVNNGPYAVPANVVRNADYFSPQIDALGPNDTLVLKIRTPATTTTPPSGDNEFRIYPRQSAITDTLTYDSSTAKVLGVNSTMQYRVKGSTTWTSVSGTSIDVSKLVGSNDVVLEVRKISVSPQFTYTTRGKIYEIYSASLSVELILPRII